MPTCVVYCTLLHFFAVLFISKPLVIRGAQRAESLMLSDSKDLGLNHPNHAPTKADFHTCNLAPTRFFTRTIIGQEMGIQKATKSAFMDL